MDIHVRMLKTHPDAVLPKRNHDDLVKLNFDIAGTGDTGYDLTAVEDVLIPARGSNVAPVGIEVAYIEPGYWFKIEARSGLGFKHSVDPHFGVIDNQYRGNLGVKLYNKSDKDYQVKKGDRVAQIVFYPLISADIDWTEVKQDSARGEKGFGSSG